MIALQIQFVCERKQTILKKVMAMPYDSFCPKGQHRFHNQFRMKGELQDKMDFCPA